MIDSLVELSVGLSQVKRRDDGVVVEITTLKIEKRVSLIFNFLCFVI